MLLEVALLFIVVLLAYSNGANDVSKGIATLIGSGTTSIRRATMWGVATTALGSLAAVTFGGLLLKIFSSDLLVEGSDPGTIAASVAAGAVLWVSVASLLGLPVSTTHALVGAIVGAALAQFGSAGIFWHSLGEKVFLPLLISPLVSFGITYFIYPVVNRQLARSREYCVCVGTRNSTVATANAFALSIPTIHIIGDKAEACAAESKSAISVRVTDGLHFVSSGFTSFARGLNDSPKIAALLLGAQAFGGSSAEFSYLIVGLGMMAGGLMAGRRVIETLSQKITTLSPIEGFASNAITAILVTCGTFLGLPFSTTHVSTSSIAAVGLVAKGTLQWSVVRSILFAWFVTLPFAAGAAFIYHAILT